MAAGLGVPCQRWPPARTQRPFSGCRVAVQRCKRRRHWAYAQSEEGLTPQQLQEQMQAAVMAEDYKEAARLRDELRDLHQSCNPVQALRERMEACVKAQEFEEAARLRDELVKAVASRALQASERTRSECVTQGVKVSARRPLACWSNDSPAVLTSCPDTYSRYEPSYSMPNQGRHFFKYEINITNEGTEAIKLLSRHWIITNANKNVEEVRGQGVVGEQPVIAPGSSFVYSSGAKLSTSSGTMEGSYTCCFCDDSGDQDCRPGQQFDVQVRQFALDMSAGMSA